MTSAHVPGGVSRTGVVMLALLALVVVAGPWISPQSPTELSTAPFQGSSWAHPLGTDVLGRDVLARLLHGGRSVVLLEAAATAIGVVVGATCGMLAAWRGGWVDTAVVWGADVFLAFPALLVLLLLVAALGPGALSVVAAVAVFHIPLVTRLVRAATLEVLGRPFIEAARLRRERAWYVLGREILPNIQRIVVADAGTRLTLSVIVIAGANFLGLGLSPPAADWGLMVGENRLGIELQPWATLAPGAAVALLTVSVNLVADSLQPDRRHTGP